MNKLSNYLKTAILLSALSALLISLGYYAGGGTGLVFAFIFSLIINLASFWFSDKIALKMAGAQEVSPDQLPKIREDLKKLSHKFDIPVPELYISNSEQPNAFATGRNPDNSAVCVTKGLIRDLDRNEVKGVIAHELAHIKNRDVLIATVAVVLASSVSFLVRGIALFGGGDRDRNPLFDLLLLITAPLIAVIIQLAISRSREYSADESAAKILGNGMPLANALKKISYASKKQPMDINPSLNSLFIANPLSGRSLSRLFSTHPPVEDRIKRLQRVV
jgi:heat shock protein HtpX